MEEIAGKGREEMDTCEQIQSKLVAGLDGELDAADRESVQAHLAQCPVCARALEEYRAIQQAVRVQEEEALMSGIYDAAAGVWEEVQSRIQTEEWALLRRELEQTRQMVRDLQAEVGVLRHQMNQHQRTRVKPPGVLLPYGISETQAARHRPLL